MHQIPLSPFTFNIHFIVFFPIATRFHPEGRFLNGWTFTSPDGGEQKLPISVPEVL
jgi:hypothetical protein